MIYYFISSTVISTIDMTQTLGHMDTWTLTWADDHVVLPVLPTNNGGQKMSLGLCVPDHVRVHGHGHGQGHMDPGTWTQADFSR